MDTRKDRPETAEDPPGYQPSTAQPKPAAPPTAQLPPTRPPPSRPWNLPRSTRSRSAAGSAGQGPAGAAVALQELIESVPEPERVMRDNFCSREANSSQFVPGTTQPPEGTSKFLETMKRIARGRAETEAAGRPEDRPTQESRRPTPPEQSPQTTRRASQPASPNPRQGRNSPTKEPREEAVGTPGRQGEQQVFSPYARSEVPDDEIPESGPSRVVYERLREEFQDLVDSVLSNSQRNLNDAVQICASLGADVIRLQEDVAQVRAQTSTLR